MIPGGQPYRNAQIEHGWRTIKRPGLSKFLETCCLELGYEIVVFSEKHVMVRALGGQRFGLAKKGRDVPGCRTLCSS
jgi:hypothetical protein